MKRTFVILFLVIWVSQNTFAQSPHLLSAYKNVVGTFKEYDVTSVDVKEIDGLSIGKGLLRFNSQRLSYDGEYLIFSYKQTPAGKYANANSKYWKPGSFSVKLPIDGSNMEVSKAFNTCYNYYVVKLKNSNGITIISNGTKELIQEYAFATSQELTANKFHKELGELIKAIIEEQYTGKLGVNTSTTNKKPQHRNSTKPNLGNRNTSKSKGNTTSKQESSVKNAGNRSTKTIIK